MLAADGLGVDVLLAERADAAVGRPELRDGSLAMLAADGVRLYFFLAERTSDGWWALFLAYVRSSPGKI